MIDLPASSLVLLDSAGRPFGQLRLVAHPEKPYAEGIFDVEPIDEAQAARSEVRWLCKRHYKRFSEHRLTIGRDGTLIVKKAGFLLTLHPDEESEGYASRAPDPPVRARWATEA